MSPAVKAFEIDKILDGKVHFEILYDEQVGLEQSACVRPFAQTSQTRNFMNGISGRFHQFLTNEVKRVLTESLGIKQSTCWQPMGSSKKPMLTTAKIV